MAYLELFLIVFSAGGIAATAYSAAKFDKQLRKITDDKTVNKLSDEQLLASVKFLDKYKTLNPIIKTLAGNYLASYKLEASRRNLPIN